MVIEILPLNTRFTGLFHQVNRKFLRKSEQTKKIIERFKMSSVSAMSIDHLAWEAFILSITIFYNNIKNLT